jgi:hypothetical protein
MNQDLRGVEVSHSSLSSGRKSNKKNLIIKEEEDEYLPSQLSVADLHGNPVVKRIRKKTEKTSSQIFNIPS